MQSKVSEKDELTDVVEVAGCQAESVQVLWKKTHCDHENQFWQILEAFQCRFHGERDDEKEGRRMLALSE